MKPRYLVIYEDYNNETKSMRFTNKIKMIRFVMKLTTFREDLTKRYYNVRWKAYEGHEDFFAIPQNIMSTAEWKEDPNNGEG